MHAEWDNEQKLWSVTFYQNSCENSFLQEVGHHNLLLPTSSGYIHL